MSTVLAAVLSAVVSAIITGIFTLIGKWIERNQKNSPQSQANISSPHSAENALSASLTTASVNYGTVLIHIGIIQLIGNVMGLIIGFFTLRLFGASLGTYYSTVFIVNTVVLVVCFIWSGTKVDRAIVWKHLTYVSIGIVIVDLLIDTLFGAAISGPVVVYTLIQTFVAMGIAGAIVLKRKAQIAAKSAKSFSVPPYQQQLSIHHTNSNLSIHRIPVEPPLHHRISNRGAMHI